MVKEKQSTKKAPRFYPAERTPKRLHRNAKPKAGKTRASITPGTVLILVAGRFRGKRVVYLKTLDNGLLLITGPFKINGVPLRVVDQAYAVATKTVVDVAGVQIPDHINAKYFKRPKNKKQKKVKAKGEFVEEKKYEKHVLPESFKADQAAVDGELVKVVKSTPHMVDYLHARFSLRNGEYPHNMQF